MATRCFAQLKRIEDSLQTTSHTPFVLSLIQIIGICKFQRGGLWCEWPYKRGDRWWEWTYKRGGLWCEWPYKRGGLGCKWPYKRGDRWCEWPYKSSRGTTVHK